MLFFFTLSRKEALQGMVIDSFTHEVQLDQGYCYVSHICPLHRSDRCEPSAGKLYLTNLYASVTYVQTIHDQIETEAL